MTSKILGAHLSKSKGLHTLQKQMEKYNLDTCAFFFSSPRTFQSKELSKDEIKEFLKVTKNPHLLLPHAPYVINLANNDPRNNVLLEAELKKCRQCNIELYNIHPGSGKKQTMKNISTNLNKIKTDVTIVIENMAGDGLKFGRTFEEIAEIISQCKIKTGVCLDTCHLFGAGYDIRTFEKFDNVMKEFNNIVGIEKLKGVHLNDSKCELNSRKDRHEFVTKGLIGKDAFEFVMQSHWFNNVPIIMETPDMDHFSKEVEMLRKFENKEL